MAEKLECSFDAGCIWASMADKDDPKAQQEYTAHFVLMHGNARTRDQRPKPKPYKAKGKLSQLNDAQGGGGKPAARGEVRCDCGNWFSRFATRNDRHQNKTAFTCCKTCFLNERKKGKRDKKVAGNSREGSQERQPVGDQEVHAYYVGAASRADAAVVSDDHPRLDVRVTFPMPWCGGGHGGAGEHLPKEADTGERAAADRRHDKPDPGCQVCGRC